MSPILRDLHWLPVRQRIVFKTAFWCTSVSTAWPQSTSRCTTSQRQLSPADVSGLLTPVDWLFPALGRATVTAVSPSRDRVRGTVFLLNSEHQAGHVQTQTEDIFVKRVAVTTAHLQHLAILRYINILNNNNNNNFSWWIFLISHRSNEVGYQRSVSLREDSHIRQM